MMVEACSVTAPPSSVEIGGKLIENVNEWPFLSLIFKVHLSDNGDILTHRKLLLYWPNEQFVV
jgi:hypothetical protein